MLRPQGPPHAKSSADQTPVHVLAPALVPSPKPPRLTRLQAQLSGSGRWQASTTARRSKAYSETAGAATLTFPYIVLLLLFGIGPVVYSLVVSFLDPISGRLTGLDNYVTAVTDFRFISSFAHVFTLMVIWVPIMMLVVVGLALLVDATEGWFGSCMRFLYYLPGAASGMANLVLWLLLLDPRYQPCSCLVSRGRLEDP